jgi:hypothetical protein
MVQFVGASSTGRAARCRSISSDSQLTRVERRVAEVDHETEP